MILFLVSNDEGCVESNVVWLKKRDPSGQNSLLQTASELICHFEEDGPANRCLSNVNFTPSAFLPLKNQCPPAHDMCPLFYEMLFFPKALNLKLCQFFTPVISNRETTPFEDRAALLYHFHNLGLFYMYVD